MPKTILVAESNECLSEALASILSTFGFKVATARCGAEIPDLILALKPDLLLIAYDLSRKVDLGAIRARFPEVKVIASGLYELTDGFAAGRTVGLDGFFCRYAPPEELQRSVRTALA